MGGAIPGGAGTGAGAIQAAAAQAGSAPGGVASAAAAPRWAVASEHHGAAGREGAETGTERGSHWPGGPDRPASAESAPTPVAAGWAAAEPGAERGSYLSGEHDRAGSVSAGSGWVSAEVGAEQGAGLAAAPGRGASTQAAPAPGASGAVAAGPSEVVSAAVPSGPPAGVSEWAGSTGWALAPERSGSVRGEAGGGREADGLVAVGRAAQASGGAPVGRVGEAARSDVPAARAQAEPGVDIPHPQDEAAHAGAATLRLRNPDAETARPHPQDEAWPPAAAPAPGASLAAVTARAEHAPRHAGPPAAWDLPGQGGSSAEQGRAPQHAVPGPAPEAEYADPYPVRDLPEPEPEDADLDGGRELTWSVPAPGIAGDAALVGSDNSPVGNGPVGNGPADSDPAGNGRPGREAADGQSATGEPATGGAADGEAVGFEHATGVAAEGEPSTVATADSGIADAEAAIAEAALDPQGAAAGRGIVPGPDGTDGTDGADITEVVARAVARIAEDDTQDLPRVTAARGVAVTEVPVHLPFRGAAHPQATAKPKPKQEPDPKPKASAPKAKAAAPARSAPGRRVPRGDDRLHEHRGPVLPGWIAVAVGGIALAGCAVVLWRAGAVPDSLALAFGAEPRPYRGLQARFWPPLAFLGVVALLALGGLGRGRAGHAWVLTLFGRYRGTVRRTGLTWISPLLLRRRVDVRLRHWRSDPMPAVDSGGLALQVVVQVVWQVKDTARATLAVEDHVDYLAEQVESAMARVLSQLPADAFHEDAPTLRDAEAVGDALTRMLASETEAVGVEVFSAQPTRIEYAPEVADAMRRRRVAAIDAKHRDTVLTSVVDAVDDTVHRLTSRGIVELDDYERKALVKDLTVAFYTGRAE
ncbi:SPFH domain-containing protein [Streptomyces sp. NBC_00193]|uniref:SPFH domain-containing protein n=1 Tax=Streptomyces sp. NBC_00193 TaxID=2975675 RepID=UPI00225B93A6|nr:SPFH domain-containing protein [Streptomyces sp. NBC_00193]MCX5298243.1 SPFH domain-containing protein [Streptomyces sp. NBC_00193]